MPLLNFYLQTNFAQTGRMLTPFVLGDVPCAEWEFESVMSIICRSDSVTTEQLDTVRLHTNANRLPDPMRRASVVASILSSPWLDDEQFHKH